VHDRFMDLLLDNRTTESSHQGQAGCVSHILLLSGTRIILLTSHLTGPIICPCCMPEDHDLMRHVAAFDEDIQPRE